MRRTKKRIGISLIVLAGILLPLAAKDKKKLTQEPYGLVGVSVFRESGLAFPNVDIMLVPSPPQDSPVKLKKMQAVSDSRGECVFRVSTAAMTYIVRAAAKGYHPEEKSVSIEGEIRVDVTLMLHEESK